MRTPRMLFLCYIHRGLASSTKEDPMVQDTKRPPRWRRVGRVSYALFFAYTVGIILRFYFRRYEATGKFHVEGYERYKAALHRGKVIIVTNHPGVPESLFLAAMWYREPFSSAPELWPYSFPDPVSFLPKYLWWCTYLLRAVPVHRAEEKKKIHAVTVAKRLLLQGEVLVLHPEGGRTTKGTHFLSIEDRRLRLPLSEGVSFLAGLPEVEILPVWVEFKGEPLHAVESYRSLIARGLTISVGESFCVDVTQKGKKYRTERMERIAKSILTVGRCPEHP